MLLAALQVECARLRSRIAAILTEPRRGFNYAEADRYLAETSRRGFYPDYEMIAPGSFTLPDSAADPRAAERPSAPTSPPGAGGHPSTPDTEDLNGDPEVELALARIELGRAHARLARYAQTYGPLPE